MEKLHIQFRIKASNNFLPYSLQEANKNNINLLKKIAVLTFYLKSQKICCINWRHFQDLNFKLLNYCITIVWVFNGVEGRGLSWALHYLNPFCPGTKMLVAYSRVWGSLSCWNPFQGHFLFSTQQHNLFKYFNLFKQIHDPWDTINKCNTVEWKTSPYHGLHHHASLSSQCTMAWIQYPGVVWRTVHDP